MENASIPAPSWPNSQRDVHAAFVPPNPLRPNSGSDTAVMKRISSRATGLFFRVLPAVGWLIAVALSIPGLLEIARARDWGVLALGAATVGAGTAMCVWNATTYDVFVRDDELILRRPFGHLTLAIDEIANVEIPSISAKLFPMELFPTVRIHWTDKRGIYRTARFVLSPWGSPDWLALRQRLGTKIRIRSGVMT